MDDDFLDTEEFEANRAETPDIQPDSETRFKMFNLKKDSVNEAEYLQGNLERIHEAPEDNETCFTKSLKGEDGIPSY